MTILRKLPKRINKIVLRRSEWQATERIFFHRPTKSTFEILPDPSDPGATRYDLVRAAFVDQSGDRPLWPQAATRLAREAIALFLEAQSTPWPGVVNEVDEVVPACPTCRKSLTLREQWWWELRADGERCYYECQHGCWGCGICAESYPKDQNCGHCKDYAGRIVPGRRATDYFAVCTVCNGWIDLGSVCLFCCCPHCALSGKRSIRARLAVR